MQVNEQKENPKILVVDDDPDMLETIKEILKFSGYNVTGTNNPNEVYALIEKGDINVLLSDINMPEMTGLELTKIIKKQYPEVIVILMTGFGEAFTVQDALMSGADEYITKPFKTAEIELIVKRASWRLMYLKSRDD